MEKGSRESRPGKLHKLHGTLLSALNSVSPEDSVGERDRVGHVCSQATCITAQTVYCSQLLA